MVLGTRGRNVGNGTMKFLLDGGGKFDRKQVGHVLEIKMNIISIVVLDKDICSVKVENGSMKVTKGSCYSLRNYHQMKFVLKR